MAKKKPAPKKKPMPKTYKGKSTKPGGGGRFQKGVDDMMMTGMSEQSARKIMAKKGRKKYGAKKFQQMATAGKKRKPNKPKK